MVPVKSYNDFSRPLVEKRVARLNSNLLRCVNLHLPQQDSVYERLCDRKRGGSKNPNSFSLCSAHVREAPERIDPGISEKQTEPKSLVSQHIASFGPGV